MPGEIAARRYCFGCGDLNPAGLKLEFRFEGNKAVADFLPQERHQGYPGLMHGGVTSAALDEAMGWAMYGLGVWAVTGKMEVKFRQPLPLNQKMTVSGEVIRSEDGRLMAESYGLFMRLSEERVRELEETYAEGQT